MEFTTRFGLHSQTTRLQGLFKRSTVHTDLLPNGPFTLCGPRLKYRTHCRTWRGAALPQLDLNTTLPSDQTTTGFGAGLIPVHSPLLRESWLVSFPPLSDMLKFSGYSRPIRGQECDAINASTGMGRTNPFYAKQFVMKPYNQSVPIQQYQQLSHDSVITFQHFVCTVNVVVFGYIREKP